MASLGKRSMGGADRIDRISNIMMKFRNDGFITPNHYELNLDIKKMMAERDVIDIFSTRYLKKDKQKDFIVLWLLDNILNNLEEVKVPIVIVLDELKELCGKEKGSKEILNIEISKALKMVGSKNTVILGDTQSLEEVNSAVVSGFTKYAIGTINSGPELKYIIKNLGFGRMDLIKLKRCPTGYFYLANKFSHGPMKVDMPTHMHREQGYYFDVIFKNTFPDKMIDYKPAIHKFRKDDKDWYSDASKLYKAQEEHTDTLKKRKEKTEVNKEKEKTIETTEELKKVRQTEKIKNRDIAIDLLKQKTSKNKFISLKKVKLQLNKMGINIGFELLSKLRKQVETVEPEEEKVVEKEQKMIWQ